MATVPNPKAGTGALWAPGEIPTAAQFNSDIRDPISFFKRLPAAIVKHGSNVSITRNTWTSLSWTDTEPADTDGIHNHSGGAPGNQRLIAVTAGWYYLFAHIRFEYHVDTTGSRAVQIRRNAGGAVGSGQRCCGDLRHSNNFQSTTPNRTGLNCSGFQTLAVSDYVECFVWHDQYFFGGQPAQVWHADGAGAANVRFGMIWMGQ